MQVLIDTNIILDYLLEREPFLQDATALFDEIDSRRIVGYVKDTLVSENNLEIFANEVEDEAPLEIPPERRRVKTDKQDPSIETLYTRDQRGNINLQPDFQRHFVWNKSKASRSIESRLLDIPIPVIYMAEEQNNKYSVGDGQQRLTSICAFINGQFPDKQSFKLSSLQVMTELNRKSFKDLSSDGRL